MADLGNEDPTVFSLADAKRIARIVRLVESGMIAKGYVRQQGHPTTWVRVTGTIDPDCPDGELICDGEGEGEGGDPCLYFPGVVTRREGPTGDWVDRGTCWVRGGNDETLVEGKRYLCTRSANIMVCDDERPSFVATLGGAGGGTTRVLRVDYYFMQDTDPPVDVLSPLCYYPATVMMLTSAGWVADPAYDPVWVVLWYTYGHVDPLFDGVPSTTVIVDGTAAVEAIDAGFEYAPENDITEPEEHPNNGQLRKVWYSVDYARAKAIDCDEVTGSPVADLGGS